MKVLSFKEAALRRDIRRLVLQAKKNGVILHMERLLLRLQARHPSRAISTAEVMPVIVREAAEGGVALEFNEANALPRASRGA